MKYVLNNIYNTLSNIMSVLQSKYQEQLQRAETSMRDDDDLKEFVVINTPTEPAPKTTFLGDFKFIENYSRIFSQPKQTVSLVEKDVSLLRDCLTSLKQVIDDPTIDYKRLSHAQIQRIEEIGSKIKKCSQNFKAIKDIQEYDKIQLDCNLKVIYQIIESEEKCIHIL